MSEKSKEIVKSSTGLTRFDPKARKELVIRGLTSLDEVRDADFYFFKGELHRIKGGLRQAIDNYEKALHIDPKHEVSLFWMGYCYMSVVMDRTSDDLELDENIRNERAAQAFQKLIDIREKKGNPLAQDYVTYYNLGHSQYDLNLYEEAIENFKKSIKLNQKDEYSYIMLGHSLGHLDLYKEAIENYEKAIKLNPNDAYSYYELGISQSHLDLDEEAIENYEEAIKLNPNDAYFYDQLAFSQIHLGLYEEATENFKRSSALRPPPKNVNSRDYNIGNLQYDFNLYEDAIGSFEKAIKMNPDDTGSYYKLGLCQEKMDLKHLALENFEKFLNRNGNKKGVEAECAKRRVKQLKVSLSSTE